MNRSRVSQIFAFMRYYLRLRWRVWKQLHQTNHSLGLIYRWRYWQRNPRLNPDAARPPEDEEIN